MKDETVQVLPHARKVNVIRPLQLDMQLTLSQFNCKKNIYIIYIHLGLHSCVCLVFAFLQVL